MLLNEAIRLGSMLYPQGKQGRMDGDTRCALGAAAEALGMKAMSSDGWMGPMVPYTTLQNTYPILDLEMVPPEGIGLNGRYPLMQIIWAMNDSAGWSREQIAEWLEGIEATLDPVPYASAILCPSGEPMNGGGYMVDGQARYEHRLVVERALGHDLPKGAVIHHINSQRTDNRPENLVVCPNHSYHRELHQRQRVYRAGGNPWTDKICNRCLLVLPRANFGRRQLKWVRSYCRACERTR